MSNLKHTPGKWGPVYGHISGDAKGVQAESDGQIGKNIVNFRGISRPYSEEGRANARLIAAAPEMLEALIDIHGVLCTTARLQDWHDENFRATIGNAQAVIEKATGMNIEEVLS